MENIKKRQTWSKEELEIIISFYSTEGAEYCHKLLPNRTINSIALKAQRLGILRDKYWSMEELDIITKFYPLKGNYYCQGLLPKRTYNSINLKASELGLRGDSRIKSHEDYENQLFEMQSDAYPLEPYIRALTPIKHTCLKDHIWYAAPNDILRGRGCPSCAIYGFNADKPATLYYICIEDKYYKVGITNRTIEERFNLDKEKNIKIIAAFNYSKGIDAKTAEKAILLKYRDYLYKGPKVLKSGGNSELFSVDLTQV